MHPGVARSPQRPTTIVLAVVAAILGGDALAQGLELDEVVVTARKREESLQDIPVAVTAFSSEDIARRGINELDDVALYTPGLVFEDFASSFSAAPVLRGLTQFNVSSEVQNVATFVDGIYIQRNYAVDISGADVQRIEVVKGPQSALYGQNAFAGTINYVLNRPGEELDGLAEVTAGTDGRLDYRVAAGGPLIDGKLGLRGSYFKSEFDGTWENEYPGLSGDQKLTGNWDNETWSVMAVVTPTDWLELDATFMQVDRNIGIRPGFNISTGDVQNTGNCGPAGAGSPPNPVPRYICGVISENPDLYQSSRSTRPRGAQVVNLVTPGFRNETDFLSANAKLSFSDGMSLVYHYGDVDSEGQEISSAAPNAVAPSIGLNLSVFGSTGMLVFGPFNTGQKEGSTNEFKSHELRFEYAPEGGPLAASVGAYRSEFDDVYRFYQQSVAPGVFIVDSTSSYLDVTGFPFGLTDRVNKGETTAYFGTLSYTFAERLTLGAEIRYSEEEKSVLDVRANITLRDEFDDWIPRFTADYKLTDDTLLYASVGKGLKTGGFNGVTAGTVTIPEGERAFGPETNWTYEIGSKNTLLDRRLVLNVALFQVDWSDLQIQDLPSNTPPAAINTTPVIYRNLGSARSRGIELETVFAITENLAANLGASYTQPEFKDGTRSGRFAVSGRCDDVICPRSGAIGGNTLPRTAETQAVAGLQYSGKFGSDFSYFVRGDVVYQSEMQAEEMNLGQIPSRTLVNVRGGLARGGFEAALWGKNVFDEEYIANSFFIVQGVAYGTSYGELATFGATLTYRF